VGVDDTPQALLQCLSAETYEQPKGLPHQAQISQQLFDVNPTHALDRLDFNNQTGSHDQIDAKGGIETHAIVHEVDRLLPQNPMPTPIKLRREQRLVNAFEKTRTNPPVQQERSIDDVGRNRLKIIHLRAFAPSLNRFFLFL